MANIRSTPSTNTGGTNIADLLERVLDKGIVVAGDIKVKLVDIELLTVQIRLVVCSIDKAKEMGMDWWANSSIFQGDLKKTEEPPLPEAKPAAAALPAMSENAERLIEASEQRAAQLEAQVRALTEQVQTLQQTAQAAVPALAEPARRASASQPEPSKAFRPILDPPSTPEGEA